MHNSPTKQRQNLRLLRQLFYFPMTPQDGEKTLPPTTSADHGDYTSNYSRKNPIPPTTSADHGHYTTNYPRKNPIPPTTSTNHKNYTPPQLPTKKNLPPTTSAGGGARSNYPRKNPTSSTSAGGGARSSTPTSPGQSASISTKGKPVTGRKRNVFGR